jgi:hypothetical protein
MNVRHPMATNTLDLKAVERAQSDSMQMGRDTERNFLTAIQESISTKLRCISLFFGYDR